MDGIEKKAREWVKTQRQAGKDDSDIKGEMLRKGYSAELADKLLKRKSRLLYIIPVLIIIAVGVYFALAFILSSISIFFSEVCTTQECFISAANNCENVKMQQVEAGSLFEYSAKSCIMEKTLKTINETEPVEMKDLLEGKSLTCSYAQNNFNENWVKTLSIGIEDCSGELKDAIDELVYAV